MTGVKLTDIGVSEVDASWYFMDNHDDEKVSLSNGKHLRVALFDCIHYISYYADMDKETTKHYGSDDWMQNFGSAMAAARKEAKVDFAAQKDDLYAKAKEAGVDITHTHQGRNAACAADRVSSLFIFGCKNMDSYLR